MTTKLSEQLQQQLAQPDAPDMLDIIIELQNSTESEGAGKQSRQEKIAAMKESFDRDVAPIDKAVRDLGGDLSGHAWINRTVRARVPAQGLKALSAQELIARIDVPHELEPDALRNSH